MTMAQLESSSNYVTPRELPADVWNEVAESLLSQQRVGPLRYWKSSAILPFLRTCREFHGLATPLLYRHLKWPADRTSSSEALENVLTRYNHLQKVVRSLSIIGSPNAWNIFHEGGGRLVNIPPLGLFPGLRRVHLQDINFTSDLHLALITLPKLHELTLLRCNLAVGSEFAGQTSLSLKTLNLNFIQQEGYTVEAFLKYFPSLHDLRLTTFRTQTTHILGNLVTQRHSILGALTSLKVVLNSHDVVATFAELLDIASNLEVVDIGFSKVDAISLNSSSIPHLHTYRGPPHLAEPFIKGRNIHTVAFVPLLDGNHWHLIESHLGVLQMSFIPVTTLFIYPSWPCGPSLTPMIQRSVTHNGPCEILGTGRQERDLWMESPNSLTD